MGVFWTSFILVVGFSGDAGRGVEPEEKASASQRPVWIPRFFQGNLWKKKYPESNLKPRGDESAMRRPSLTFPVRRRTEVPGDNLVISRCRAALHQELGLKDSPIYVQFNDGILTLTGYVTDIVLKDRAERIARKIDGVVEVRNDLVIANEFTAIESPRAVHLEPPVKPHQMQTLRPSNEVIEAREENSKGELSQLNVPQAGASVRLQASIGERAIPAPPKRLAELGWTQVNRNETPWVPRVVLEPPQQIRIDPELPVVVTYVLPTTPMTEAELSAKASRIPAMIESDAKITAAGAAQSSQPAPLLSVPPLSIPMHEGDATTDSAQSNSNAKSATLPKERVFANKLPASHRIPSANVGNGHRDIADLLAADSAYRRIQFRVQDGEVMLSGAIGTPTELYELAEKLSQVSGVSHVSFERIHFER